MHESYVISDIDSHCKTKMKWFIAYKGNNCDTKYMGGYMGGMKLPPLWTAHCFGRLNYMTTIMRYCKVLNMLWIWFQCFRVDIITGKNRVDCECSYTQYFRFLCSLICIIEKTLCALLNLLPSFNRLSSCLPMMLLWLTLSSLRVPLSNVLMYFIHLQCPRSSR